MPFLDWSARNIALKIGAHPSRGSEMTVGMDGERWGELLEALSECLQPGGGELRVELAGEWRLFWKLRDGESRLLLAHPTVDSYVGTLALVQPHGVAFLAAMRAVGDVGRVTVGDHGPVASVSNFDLVLEKLADGREAGVK